MQTTCHFKTILPTSALSGLITLVLTLFIVTPASAHGPSPQRLEEHIMLSADPETVWSMIGDFHKLAEWHPLVSASDGDGGNTTGATREVALAGGNIVERLDRHKDEPKLYSYRVLHENTSALPASFYSATLTVRPANGGSEVIWKGMFYRADTSNYPSDEMNDDAGREALSHFFRTGLESLQEMTVSQH